MAPRSCCLPLLVADTREHWSHQPLSVISYRCDSPVGSQTELASLCDWPRQTESSSGRQQQHTSPLQSRPVDDYAHMPTQPQTTAAPPMSSPSIAASSSPVGTEVDLNSSRAMCGTTQRDDDMNEVFLLLNFTDQVCSFPSFSWAGLCRRRTQVVCFSRTWVVWHCIVVRASKSTAGSQYVLS